MGGISRYKLPGGAYLSMGFITSKEFLDASSGTFTAVMFKVEVFWVITLCSGAVGYQRFRSMLHFTLKMWAARTSEMLVYNHSTSRRHNPEDIDLKNFLFLKPLPK
jgi:hypothetical protein